MNPDVSEFHHFESVTVLNEQLTPSHKAKKQIFAEDSLKLYEMT